MNYILNQNKRESYENLIFNVSFKIFSFILQYSFEKKYNIKFKAILQEGEYFFETLLQVFLN